MSDVVVRPGEPTAADAQAFCALSNSLYARKVDAAYYTWQFHDCPHAPKLFTAWAEGELVGAYGVHVCAPDDAGARRAMMLDIMVRHDRQGAGLVRPLGQAAHAYARDLGAQHLCVVANARAQRAHARHFGWTVWRELTEWVRVSTAPSPSRPDEVDEHSASGPVRGFYPRDPKTLDWRTARNPRYRYEWTTVESRSGRARAVTKSFDDPVTREKSVDLLAILPPSIVHVGDVLAALSEAGVVDGSHRCTTIPLDADEALQLREAGFQPSTRKRHVCGAGPLPDGLGWGMLDVDVY